MWLGSCCVLCTWSQCMDYPCVRKALKVACRYTRKKELPPPVGHLFYLMPLSFSLSLRSQLLSVPTSGSTPADLTTIADTTPFTLMFGPDKYIFSEYIVFGRFICMRVCACVCARVCVCVCECLRVSSDECVCSRVWIQIHTLSTKLVSYSFFWKKTLFYCADVALMPNCTSFSGTRAQLPWYSACWRAHYLFIFFFFIIILFIIFFFFFWP